MFPNARVARTARHSFPSPYPAVDFTWSPAIPRINQLTQFTDLTVFYDTGGSGQRAWLWNFGDNTASASQQNPTHAYAAAGAFNVTDTATDKDGYVCSLSKPISIQSSIPVWKEVSPK